jgi:hypothetical protein
MPQTNQNQKGIISRNHSDSVVIAFTVALLVAVVALGAIHYSSNSNSGIMWQGSNPPPASGGGQVMTTFVEMGLPNGALFAVTYDNITNSTTVAVASNSVLFSTPAGVHAYLVPNMTYNGKIYYIHTRTGNVGSGIKVSVSYLSTNAPTTTTSSVLSTSSVTSTTSASTTSSTTTINNTCALCTGNLNRTPVVTTFVENGLPVGATFRVNFDLRPNTTTVTSGNTFVTIVTPKGYVNVPAQERWPMQTSPVIYNGIRYTPNTIGMPLVPTGSTFVIKYNVLSYSTSTIIPNSTLWQIFFEETGLPNGALFSMEYANQMVNTTVTGPETTISFTQVYGNYYYTLSNSVYNGITYYIRPQTWGAGNESTGLLCICTAATILNYTYAAATTSTTSSTTTSTSTSTTTSSSTSTTSTTTIVPATTFTENGLPSGSKFNVTYGSVSKAITVTPSNVAISISTAAAGNYPYVISSSSYGGTGYLPTPNSGTMVSGANIVAAFAANQLLTLPTGGNLPSSVVLPKLNNYLIPNITASNDSIANFSIIGVYEYSGYEAVLVGCDSNNTDGYPCLLEFDFDSSGNLLNVTSNT